VIVLDAMKINQTNKLIWADQGVCLIMVKHGKSLMFVSASSNKNGFFISPNGFYGTDGWHLPEEGKTYYRVLSDDTWNIGFKFDCENKSHEQINTANENALFVRFIKL
jgi:hypothetical protein